MPAALEVSGLTAGYSGVPVVHGLELRVAAGEIVALLGPNGAGKTTSLLAISGLIKPLAGTVRVAGRSPSLARPFMAPRIGLAHVPEDRSLFFDLTVKDNLRLACRSGSVQEAVDYFPALGPLLGRKAGLLSGGEQQMLALGRALVTKPSVLMVDEMSLGLAPVIVQRLMPILRTVADEQQCAILLVEQHIHMALEVADRAYVLRRGRIALEGTSAELLGDPETLHASYLGEFDEHRSSPC